MFKLGQLIERKDGFNVYKVVRQQGGLLKLECVSFVQSEDLGDNIWIRDYNDAEWVAMSFFEPEYQNASYRIL